MFYRLVWWSTIALIATLFINYRVGTQTSVFADQFAILAQPPGRVFGVARWSIYLTLTIAVLSRRSYRISRHTVRQRIAKLFLLSCLFNAWRIMVTAYASDQILLSVALLWLLRVTVVKILTILVDHSLRIHSSRIHRTAFALYTWWMSVAFRALGTIQLLFALWFESVWQNILINCVALTIAAVAVIILIKQSDRRVWILPALATFSVAWVQLMTAWGDLVLWWYALLLFTIIIYEGWQKIKNQYNIEKQAV